MAKRNRRREIRKDKRGAYAAAKPTPTHWVRLTRVKVVIDPTRRWFVVRTVAQREGKVTKRLQEIALLRGRDLVIYRATEAIAVMRRGRQALREAFPAAGYLFVGTRPDESVDADRAALRAISDAEVFADRDELFKRILGPFAPAHLERFARHVSPPPMLELVHRFKGTIAVFPVRVPFPGNYRADMTSVMAAA